MSTLCIKVPMHRFPIKLPPFQSLFLSHFPNYQISITRCCHFVTTFLLWLYATTLNFVWSRKPRYRTWLSFKPNTTGVENLAGEEHFEINKVLTASSVSPSSPLTPSNTLFICYNTVYTAPTPNHFHMPPKLKNDSLSPTISTPGRFSNSV